MFWNYYFVKNHKIAYNSTISQAWVKNKYWFGIPKILEFFDARLTKLMYNPISLNKIMARFIITIRPHILSKVYPLDRLENVYHYSKSLFQLIFQIVFKLIILILVLV